MATFGLFCPPLLTLAPCAVEEIGSANGASVRSAILLLIVRPLRDASPDTAKFSHLLLGFDVSEHPRSLSNQRSLRTPAPSHCFTVTLSLLDSPSFSAVYPHQARLALEILYRLVSSRFTAERTLQYESPMKPRLPLRTLTLVGRFVRNRQAIQKDFFSDLIQQQIASFNPNQTPTLLSSLWQRTYLLKTLAIDLRTVFHLPIPPPSVCY